MTSLRRMTPCQIRSKAHPTPSPLNGIGLLLPMLSQFNRWHSLYNLITPFPRFLIVMIQFHNSLIQTVLLVIRILELPCNCERIWGYNMYSSHGRVVNQPKSDVYKSKTGFVSSFFIEEKRTNAINRLYERWHQ